MPRIGTARASNVRSEPNVSTVTSAASAEAMDELRQILAGRSAFYSKAQLSVDTSGQPLEATYELLRREVREAIGLPQ